jgi:hypothetical protein
LNSYEGRVLYICVE